MTNIEQDKTRLIEAYPALSFKAPKVVKIDGANNLKQNKGNPRPRAGTGRKLGVPNKITTETKTVIKNLLEENHENMSIWLAQVAEVDPAKALDIIIRLTAFIVPKLASQEVTGKDGGAIESNSNVTVEFINAKKLNNET